MRTTGGFSYPDAYPGMAPIYRKDSIYRGYGYFY